MTEASPPDPVSTVSPTPAPAPAPGEARAQALVRARALLADGGAATLTTLTADGWPYPSLVLVAPAVDGQPVLLLSSLAEHSRNLAGDGRAGLLIDGTAGLAERMTGPRLSLTGRVVPDDDPDSRARYLDRHPAARLYADFGDFGFRRFVIGRAHLVAGFGRAFALKAGDLLGAG